MQSLNFQKYFQVCSLSAQKVNICFDTLDLVVDYRLKA